MIRRAWVVGSILWTVFWTYLYVISGPLTPEEHVNLKASVTAVMAIPWLGGWLVSWIVNGKR